jgi:hypothetical protein
MEIVYCLEKNRSNMLKLIIASIIAFCSLSADEIDLSGYEYSVYSRSGEDGIFSKIFQLTPPSSFFCVELGSGDGCSDSPTLVLRLQGWNSLLLDRLYENHGEHLFKEFLTAQNINEILQKYCVPQDLDLLCIDTGYNDYYLWKGIDPIYQPAVVMIRYNPTLLPVLDNVVKYRPYFGGDHSSYFGASILALQKLGKSKGYTLIYAERSGSYLFFIRDAILLEKNLKFKNCGDVDLLYPFGSGKQPQYEDPKFREWICSKDLE